MGPWATADRKQSGLTHSLAENDDTGRPESLHGCICCSEHRSCWISLEQKLHQKGYQGTYEFLCSLIWLSFRFGCMIDLPSVSCIVCHVFGCMIDINGLWTFFCWIQLDRTSMDMDTFGHFVQYYRMDLELKTWIVQYPMDIVLCHPPPLDVTGATPT